jgi:hypothetical protein
MSMSKSSENKTHGRRTLIICVAAVIISTEWLVYDAVIELARLDAVTATLRARNETYQPPPARDSLDSL